VLCKFIIPSYWSHHRAALPNPGAFTVPRPVSPRVAQGQCGTPSLGTASVLMGAGGALGRLLPCDELPCPLRPAAAAALVDGLPPAPLLSALALALRIGCLPCDTCERHASPASASCYACAMDTHVQVLGPSNRCLGAR
jgi:hypothetical protein